MQVIAHRGAKAYQPENTIKAFLTALDMGSDFFETDVQLNKAGVLVLAHDYLIAGDKKKYDTLEQLLDILKPDTKLNIEIKNDEGRYRGIEQKVMDLLNARGAALKERILISSFDYPTLQRIRALDKTIKIGVLTRSFNLKEALDIGAYSVNISIKIITKEIVDTCHKNNLKVYVYTVNAAADARAMESLGVDAIFSDYPEIKSL